MDAFFTRLYVSSSLPLADLVDVAESALSTDADGRSITTDVVDVSFGKGDDFDPVVVSRDPTNFLRYPYSVEIEAMEGATLEQYLDVVALLMRELHKRGATIVASCDWEDDLPGSGRLGDVFRT
jgi:hypothetical protein